MKAGVRGGEPLRGQDWRCEDWGCEGSSGGAGAALGQLVGSVGDDDPGGEVGEGYGADGAEEKDYGDKAHDRDIPAIFEGEGGADTGDEAVVARTHERAAGRGHLLEGRARLEARTRLACRAGLAGSAAG
jgi:hypothetical protein